MTDMEVKAQLKEFFVNELGVDADELQYDTILFNEGIGLDSIDSIELVAFIDETFGVQTSGIDRENFKNIDTLAAYIVAHM